MCHCCENGFLMCHCEERSDEAISNRDHRKSIHSAGSIMAFYRQITTALLITIFVGLAPGVALGFSDTRDHWASPQIDHLHSRELLFGYPDGTFRPDAYMTREEFVTLLINIMGKGYEANELAKGKSSFNDMSDRWSKGYVELGRELNLLEGIGNYYFYPQQVISREEAVSIMVRSLGATEIETTEPLIFTDGAKITPWARPSVFFAVENELVNGFPDGTFRPHEGVTRAQAASMMEQYLNYLGQSHHFYGKITAIDLQTRKAIVEINGQAQTFNLADQIKAYSADTSSPLAEIPLNLPVYIDVDSQGYLAYVYITQNKKHGEVDLRFTALDNSQRQHNTGKPSAQVMNNDDNDMISAHSPNQATSLQITSETIRAAELKEHTGATGLGQLVAVIDSGIDLGHPDLQLSESQYHKIVEIVDLTQEGKINLVKVPADSETVNTEAGILNVKGIDNYDYSFLYGEIDLNKFPQVISSLFKKQKIAVIVTASSYPGLFDTVYIDTDMDMDLTDETPITVYAKNQEVISIPADRNKKLNLAVSEISSANQYIKLFFDALGHGTHVAGIVAANGQIEGIAPNAQLLAIKVSDQTGTTSLAQISSALALAAERGANVAVVSMGQLEIYSDQVRDAFQSQLKNLCQKYNMIICLAAGNDGPGLGTIADTAVLDYSISVGAFSSPRMWMNDYGWVIDNSTLWYFSSFGPSPDGAVAPDLLAPGSAVSTYPLWSDSIYHLEEGTSVAVPHVAGAAALLRELAVTQMGMEDALAIINALEKGAEYLAGYEPFEQGFGVVNVVRAWDYLQTESVVHRNIEATQFTPSYGYGQGYFSKSLQPGKLKLYLTNNGDQHEIVEIQTPDWIKASQQELQLPSKSTRSVFLEYESLSNPGIYTDYVNINRILYPNEPIKILQTIIVPYQLFQMNNGTLEASGELGPGKMMRYFYKIPAGMDKLTFQLQVQQGRARIHVIAPDGCTDASNFAGKGQVKNQSLVEMGYLNPQEGVWEVVVYSSSSLSDFQEKSSIYNLTAVLYGKAEVKPIWSSKYLVSSLPRASNNSSSQYITLNFWDPITKQPAQGVVSVNGKLYEIDQGKIITEVVPGDEKIRLTLAW